MIISKDQYRYPQYKKFHLFETSKEFATICKECKCNLTFLDNTDCDTELAEKVKTRHHMIQRKIQTVPIIYLLLNALIVNQLIRQKFQQFHHQITNNIYKYYQK